MPKNFDATAVAGVKLKSLAEPIYAALHTYVEKSEFLLTLDVDSAVRLETIAGKPNSARSTTQAKFHGRNLGSLVVIAFAPGDCTGDENTFSLTDIKTAKYPAIPGIVPRSKSAVHTEAHFTLASAPAEQSNGEPVLFAGKLTLLGLHNRTVAQIGTLGQSNEDYEASIGSLYARPIVTATTGYRDAHDKDVLGRRAIPALRFGDPHAVFNATEDVQVAAFIGVPPGMTVAVSAFNRLQATIPTNPS